MTLERLQEILAEIRYKNCAFVCGLLPLENVAGSTRAFWIQVQYPVVEKGLHRIAKGRRWIIEADNTPWQIVATAFKACLTVEEHETREGFLYKGAAVFYPHHDLDELVALRQHHATVAGTSEAEDKV